MNWSFRLTKTRFLLSISSAFLMAGLPARDASCQKINFLEGPAKTPKELAPGNQQLHRNIAPTWEYGFDLGSKLTAYQKTNPFLDELYHTQDKSLEFKTLWPFAPELPGLSQFWPSAKRQHRFAILAWPSDIKLWPSAKRQHRFAILAWPSDIKLWPSAKRQHRFAILAWPSDIKPGYFAVPHKSERKLRALFDFYGTQTVQNLPNQQPGQNPDLPKGPLPSDNPVPDPNRDRFLQPLPQPTEPEPPEIPDLERVPPEQPLPEQPDAVLEVIEIQVVGSTVLTPEEIEAIAGPLEGRVVPLAQLRQVGDTITEIYLERGYITSRAILPPQTVVDGVVKIEVLEGILGEIQIEGLKRLNPSYLKSRIRLGADQPLDTASLENQLRLLRANPLLENVEASLRASQKEGESILIVRVTEAEPFDVSVNIDNYSPPSVGSERGGVTVVHRNLTGNGDLFVASYNSADLIGDGDSEVFDFIYNFPINAMNGTVQLRVAPNRNSITQAEFREFDIRGNTEVYEFSYRQPLVRTPVEEFAVSLGLSYQQSNTLVLGDSFGFGAGRGEGDGTNTSTVIKLGQDYLRRDPKGAWALRSQFNLGVDLFDATVKSEPIPDGRFLSWQGQIQRIQRLSANHLLIVQSDVQLSTTPLLPSHQFVIGGGLSLRGYRQNVRSGDNGFRFSIEDRITFERDDSGLPTIQFIPFIDAGAIWNNGDNPNNEFLPSQRFLVGAGMGVVWQPVPQFNIRLDYGIPLIELNDRGNNAQDSGFYFSVIFRP